MININIIEANETHIPQIVELWKQLMDYHHNLDEFYTPREDAHVNFDSFAKELIKSEDVNLFIAIENNNVVGYTSTKIDFYPPIYSREKYGAIY